MGQRLCRFFVAVFALLYCGALALLFIGTFGLLGAERDPLSGVYLIPLGLPWNQTIDVFPDTTWPWLAAAAPALNLAILWLMCRRKKRQSRT